MRRVATVVVLVLALAAVVRGDEPAPPTTTTTLVRPPIEHATEVQGTLPDLVGRWLMVATVSVGSGPKHIIASVFDVTRKDGQPEVVERHVVLPKAQNDALEHGNEIGGVWDPTPDDLAAIRDAWDRLEPEDRGIARMTNILTGRDAYDDDLKNEPLTKDALWVLRQQYVFLPGGSRPVNQANLIAPMKLERGVYSGGFVAVAVAAAPFPIPIKFEGTFELISLGRSSPSFWQRLGDVFAGCNGR
jgi:hypothetical protein